MAEGGEEGGDSEGLNLGGAEDSEKKKEEEEDDKGNHSASQYSQQNWNQDGWNNRNQGWGYAGEYPGTYYMGEQAIGGWDPVYVNPGFYILQKDKEKVDAGEIVDEGFQVKTRKKFRDPKIKDAEKERNLMALKTAESETVKVDAVMDSGAFDIVIPKEMMGGNEIRETRASKAGCNWYDVQGGVVRNLGEGEIKGVSEDGIPIEFTAQVGEGVKKMLLSVKRACKSGNMIIFGADMKAIRDLAKLDKIEDNVIIGTKSGVRSEIKEKNGMYVYPMTITRKKRGNDMDIGIVSQETEEESDKESGRWIDGLWSPF